MSTLRKLAALLFAAAPLAHGGEVYLDMEISARAPSDELHQAKLDTPLVSTTLAYEPASQHGRFALFARHTSSVPRVDDRGGLNEIGARWRVKLD